MDSSAPVPRRGTDGQAGCWLEGHGTAEIAEVPEKETFDRITPPKGGDRINRIILLHLILSKENSDRMTETQGRRG